MDFKLIKKVLFAKGPAISMPSEEKKVALTITFLALVLMFGGMYLFLGIKEGFGKNDFEKLIILVSFAYIVIQFYNIIVRYAGSQEALDDLKNPDKKRKIIAKDFLIIALPVLIIYFIDRWLKTNNYFGWFK